jgi:hypothetical protein
MELSQDTKSVIDFMQNTAGVELRKPNDLGTILETGAAFGLFALVNSIVFTGKSLWNIQRSLQSPSASEQDILPLKKEYEYCIFELKQYLAELLRSSDDKEKLRFENIYLQNSSGALKNLLDLAHDLSEFKMVQSMIKNSHN